MIQIDLKSLISRLNPQGRRALEGAAGLCISRGHYEVSPEHFLNKLVDDTQNDISQIFSHYEIDPGRVLRLLESALEQLKAGNPGKPVFSPLIQEWLADAWLIATVEFRQPTLRTGALLAALLGNPRLSMSAAMDEIAARLSYAELKKICLDVTASSPEAVHAAAQPQDGQGTSPPSAVDDHDALSRFTINFTERARKGEIDPVFCRDNEIRQMIDILGRRRKNNPICVGEAGVGKTAVVEGLALKIIQGDVPDFLKNVDIIGLDLGLLQAGAGVKGEFENRLKAVITQIKGSSKPLITFIDEAHTLIGAGGQAGQNDAANLLKPALARGELRTIAATTWSEYKKYFEKDPALARRFQLIKLDEPSVDQAVVIIRGVRENFERAHGVFISDAAVIAAARMSARYISGRQLPDKAVDVIDTAAARVKLSLTNKPTPIDDKERRVAEYHRELDAIHRDLNAGTVHLDHVAPRMAEIKDAIRGLSEQIATLTLQWESEAALVGRIQDLRRRLGDISPGAPDAMPSTDHHEPPPNAHDSGETIKAELAAAKRELAEIQGNAGLIDYEVTETLIARVIGDWTGIPVGSMIKDEVTAVLGLGDRLRDLIKGQDQAIEIIDQGLRAAKAGLNNPGAPMGVFLLVGPSGVGKTETATRVAELMFGGARFMVSVNMSEFQEKASVSRLIGSAPGYVGYGEGGQLTEAVRQRPYSVVLLDECEKADTDVLNLFYQVFDKGVLNDGEGREIDFKNTIIFLTSNLASDIILNATRAAPDRPLDLIIADIKPVLSAHFKPALLARMNIVPFLPLAGAPLENIVRLKLNAIGDRLKQTYAMSFSYSTKLVEIIKARCTDVESGARNVDYIITQSLLPQISTKLLEQMSLNLFPTKLEIDVDAHEAFSVLIS